MRVARQLDVYRDSWARTHTEVCLASQRGVQSAALLDARMHCLELSLSRLDATARVLEEADAQTVERAAQIVAELPRASSCQTLRPRRGQALPGDPKVRAAIRTVSAAVDRAEALRLAARYKEARSVAEEAVGRAEGQVLQGVRARALDTLGRTQDKLADHKAANSTMQAAYFTALEAGEDELAAEIAAKLIGNVGGALGDHDAAMLWARHGASVAQRSSSQVAQAVVAYALGTLHLRRSELDDAAKQLGRARDLLERSVGDEHGISSRVYNNLGVIETLRGRHQESIPFYQRAYDIWSERGGPTHPETISLLNNLALPLANQGKFEEAQGYYERSIELLGHSLGPNHPELIDPLTNLGLIHANLGRHHRAAEPIRRAIDIRIEASGAEHPEVGQLRSYLAEVLFEAGDIEQAATEADAAIDLMRREVGEASALLVEPLERAALIARAQSRRGDARALVARALAIATATGDVAPGVVDRLRALEAELR